MSLKLTGKWTEKYAGQTEIELEDDTFVIPKSAFEYNYELKFIALPDSISIIYNSAFEKCESLEKIIMPKSIDFIGERVFMDCANLKGIELPEGLTEISTSAFFCCKSLEYIRIPEGVKRIGINAFTDCVSLKKIYLPDSLEIIDDYAFEGCVNLETVEGGESVIVIGDYAFHGCANLSEIKFSSSLDTIYETTFLGSSVKVPGYILDKLNDKYISDTTVCVPDGILTVTAWSLERNDGSSWDKVILPDSVRNISYNAFYSVLNYIFSPDSTAENRISSLPKKMNMPRGYFRQKTAFNTEMAFLLADTVWKDYVTDEDFEYMLLYQNSKTAQYGACDVLSENCNEHLVNMMNITDNSPIQLEHLAAYAATYLNKIDFSNLKTLRLRAKSNKAYKALEILDKYCFDLLNNKDDDITEFCLKYFSPFAAERYFPDDSNVRALLNRVRYYKNGSYVPEYIVKCVLYAYMRQLPDESENMKDIEGFQFVSEADKIVSEFDRESFMNVIKDIPLEDTQLLIPVCRYGDADTVNTICDEILNVNSSCRVWRANIAKTALRLNETDEAKVLQDGINYAESCDDNYEEDDFEDNFFEDDDFEFDTEEEYLL